MKIVAATWERRNLGLDVTEITFDSLDLERESEILETLKTYMTPRHYLLVKIPTGAIAFLAKLQALEFIFLECQYTISKKIRNYAAPSLFSSLAGRLSFEPLSEDIEEWKELYRLIGNDTFTTDRVALDPLFNVNIANTRYKNWLMDMKGNLSIFVTQIKCEGKSVGFFADSVDLKTQTAHALIGGIFKSYQGAGLGGALIHGPLALNAEKGMHKFITAISSNNFDVFQWYVFFDFSIDKCSYVLRHYKSER
jgi:hypothetical protein